MENQYNKAFKILFRILAFLAFIGIILGAYHQIIFFLMCIGLQFFCATPKSKEVQYKT